LKAHILIISVISILLFATCKQSVNNNSNEKQPSSKESLVKVNRYMVKSENEDIENYIHRHQWKMEKTGSGLRIMIYEEGSGEPAKKGQIVELDYELTLITGDVVYSSKENGPMIFKIGYGGVETGLEEAILLMKMGDKAKLVIPSHLAHGFLGDDNLIPPRSTVIYDIEIINLK